MITKKQIGNGPVSGNSSKGKIAVGLVIFLLGVVVGVIGLCAAFKLIFYIGLIVTVIAAVALVWGILRIKTGFSRDDDGVQQ